MAAKGGQSLSEDPGQDDQSLSMVSFDELAKHTSEDDCWIVVRGKAYDITGFLGDHPGGSAVILGTTGCDSTAAFEEAHPVAIMKMTLGPAGLAAAFKGDVDLSTFPTITAKNEPVQHGGEEVTDDGNEIPPLEAILNLHDMEAVAQRAMIASGKKHAWDYYSSGADDELTYNENVNAFQRIWLKPRILVNVKDIDTSTSILGHRSSLPIYLSAVAMCGMGHADGEVAWVRAAERAGVLFMVSRPLA
jgi:L-lactate dehydrogenase (cytochrome)